MIEQLRAYFGIGTVVQITRGDPTLRNRRELVAIVQRTRELGLAPALMANGIKPSRVLLVELAEPSLNKDAELVHVMAKNIPASFTLRWHPTSGQDALRFAEA
jgi:hypothetical protein